MHFSKGKCYEYLAVKSGPFTSSPKKYAQSFVLLCVFMSTKLLLDVGTCNLWFITYMVALMTIFWWRHQMETFSALLAICAGNSPVPGEFPTQRPVTRSFDVYFDLRPNKRLSKQPWGWWFETLSPPLWRHRNDGNRIIVPLLVK